jgi:hypothetical protein
MKFLQLIWIERDTTDAENAAMRDGIMPWYDQAVAQGVRIIGKPLDQPATARTVRVRDGETLVTDGPFLDTKEFIGGIGILVCESLEQAIEVTAKHPIARYNAIELRELVPLPGLPDEIPEIDSDEISQLLLVCADGIPEADEVEAKIASDAAAWRELVSAAGVNVLNQPLAGPEEARVVRVREGETLISDGPFVETKEFLAGFDILDCATFDDAVGWAATHPLAAFHKVEVRQFVPFEGA